MTFQRRCVLILAVAASWSCQPSGSDRPTATGLAAITQTGDDLYADLHVRQDSIAKERWVSLRLPSGESLQVHLHPVMHPGSILRFGGKGATTKGALFLKIDTVP